MKTTSQHTTEDTREGNSTAVKRRLLNVMDMTGRTSNDMAEREPDNIASRADSEQLDIPNLWPYLRDMFDVVRSKDSRRMCYVLYSFELGLS